MSTPSPYPPPHTVPLVKNERGPVVCVATEGGKRRGKPAVPRRSVNEEKTAWRREILARLRKLENRFAREGAKAIPPARRNAVQRPLPKRQENPTTPRHPHAASDPRGGGGAFGAFCWQWLGREVTRSASKPPALRACF